MRIGVTRGSVQQGGWGGQEGVAGVHGVASWQTLIPLQPGLPAAVAKVVHSEPAAGARVTS